MTRDEFRLLIDEGIVILDGATGTELQKVGYEQGCCPEKWVLDNPESIIKLQRDYVEAGSNIVMAPTFGANRIKLKKYGYEDEVIDFNKRLVQLSKEAVNEEALVAGDMAPTGEYIEPIGMLSFEDLVEVYKEQVRGLLLGGVDLFAIETVMNIQDARAAIIAIKESCDLPIMATMTYEANGRTINGTQPSTAVVTLQNLGIDATGCNCSSGPEEMANIIKDMKPYANIPLIAKPNAGMPELINGKTIFNMDPKEFVSAAKVIIEEGAEIVGGCCGTNGSHISLLSKEAKKQVKINTDTNRRIITSERILLDIDEEELKIGKKIDASNVEIKNHMLNGTSYLLSDYIFDQLDEGINVLYINFDDIELDKVKTVFKDLSMTINIPICIEAKTAEVYEYIARIFPGVIMVSNKYNIDIVDIVDKYGLIINNV